MSDNIELLKIILGEIREHRKESAERHDKLAARVRKLENSKSFGLGIVAAVSGIVSYVIQYVKH